MNSNEKGIFCRDALKNLERGLTKKLISKEKSTMKKYKPNTIKFQYYCSFCFRELPDNSFRFNGIGACPPHYALAFRFVDALREHVANYFSNLGVRK